MAPDLAETWAGTVVPSWVYRWLMPLAWVAATTVSLVTVDDVPCAEDPSICAPDVAFALTLVPAFASLLLWWWQPRVAAVAGVVFFAAQVWYDGGAVMTEWVLFASACVALLVWFAASRRKQLALTADLPRRPVTVPAAKPVGLSGRLVVAVLLLAAGAAGLGVMRWQDQREQVHLQRAVEQTAVAGESQDGELVLKLPDGNRRVVSVLDDYEPGAQIPVLIDPADDEWARLRVEPADYTHWYAVAGGAWLLAALLAYRDMRRRRARRRESWTGAGLPVRVTPDASTDFVICSAGGTDVLAFLSADLDDEAADDRLFDAIDQLDDDEPDAPASVRQQWLQTVQRYQGEAVLVGELAEGSWPTVLLGDLALRPTAPLRAPRRTPWSVEATASLPASVNVDPTNVHLEFRLVDPARETPPLPWSVPTERPSWWYWPALIGAVLAGLVAVAWFVSVGDWVPAIGAAAGAVTVIGFVGDALFDRVSVSANEVRFRRGWSELVVDWRSVDSVEIHPHWVALRSGRESHQITRLQRPVDVAGVLEALRLRARTGLPAPSVRRRLNPQALVDVLFLAVCVGVALLVRLA
ncbi:hypothetical protein ACIBL3_13885 [Kribbella sp. NPDC050124]|uniref:hypothetical protein n=1 Tax=Kribbella sp. NPDC050124 TaxID=3364114 RepID=UPI0037A05A55